MAPDDYYSSPARMTAKFEVIARRIRSAQREVPVITSGQGLRGCPAPPSSAQLLPCFRFLLLALSVSLHPALRHEARTHSFPLSSFTSSSARPCGGLCFLMLMRVRGQQRLGCPGPSEPKEADNMSTFTSISALQRFTARELQRLEAITQQEVTAPVGSAERRDALAALHTIRIALTMRRAPRIR